MTDLIEGPVEIYRKNGRIKSVCLPEIKVHATSSISCISCVWLVSLICLAVTA